MNSMPHSIIEEPAAVERSSLANSTMSLVTRGLHARTIGQQVKSCFIDIIPIALNMKGNLTTTFATPGMILYHKTCVESLRAADITFQNSILICHTMRRLKNQLAKKQSISSESLINLQKIIDQLIEGAENARSRLLDVNTRQHLLLSSPKQFMPSHERRVTNFPLPTDIEEGDVIVRITKLIKAQMTHMVGTDNIPDIFKQLQDVIADSDTTYNDQQGIVERIDLLIKCLTRLSNLIDENKPTRTWKGTISELYEMAFLYIAQVPSVNDRIPRDPEITFLQETRVAIKKLKNAWFTVASAYDALPKPVDKWQPDDLDCCSRAILSTRESLPGVPNQMVDFVVVITQVEKLKSGHYALLINVRCRLDNESEHNTTLFRCNKLDIAVSLGQSPSSNDLRLRITGHGPSQEYYDKTERKYGSKATATVIPNSFVEVGFEVSREITKSNYSAVEAHQKKDNSVHWKVRRNKDSSAGISDCTLGVIVDAPAPEIQFDVLMKAYFEDENSTFKRFFLGKTKSLEARSTSSIIDVEEALAMEFSNSQGVEEFLDGCTVTKPS